MVDHNDPFDGGIQQRVQLFNRTIGGHAGNYACRAQAASLGMFRNRRRPWTCTKRSLCALPVWGRVTARNAKKNWPESRAHPGSGTRASEIAPVRGRAADTDEPALQFLSWQRSPVQVAL